MTIAHLTKDELLDLFREDGWEIVDDFWEIKRIGFKKGDVNFNIQYANWYGHPLVARLCKDWNLQMPEKCRKPQEQYEEYLKKKNGKDDDKP